MRRRGEGRLQCQQTWSVLQLFDEVFLFTPIVALEYDLCRRRSSVVGNVEQVAFSVQQKFLTFHLVYLSQPEASITSGRVSIGHFELHVGGRQHRSIVIFALMSGAPFEAMPAFGIPEGCLFNASWSRFMCSALLTLPAVFHKLKSSPEILFCSACCVVVITLNTQESDGFRIFSEKANSKGRLYTV